jgi:hypothetical protein
MLARAVRASPLSRAAPALAQPLQRAPPSLPTAQQQPHPRCSPTCCGIPTMGGMMSMLRMFSARLKTTVGGPPESMRKMEAAEASAPPLPAANLSWWVASTRDQAAEVPTSNEPLSDVDVCVLGGGIVGITTAYLLRKQGLKARCACARAPDEDAHRAASRIAHAGACGSGAR